MTMVIPAAFFFYFAGPGGGSTPPIPRPAEKSETRRPAGAERSVLTPPPVTPAQSSQLPELTAEQRHVTPAVLENLSQSVALDGNESDNSGNKKAQWAKAVPWAEALVARADADCAAHDWLVRFVDCGRLALGDSPDYYGAANELAGMPRDQQEAASGLPSN